MIHPNIYSVKVQFTLPGTVETAKVNSTVENTKVRAKVSPWIFKLVTQGSEVSGNYSGTHIEDGFKEGESKKNCRLVDIRKE